jgi:predicted enzyme related to lactoylglutathione lyase
MEVWTMSGKVVHFEIPADDVGRAQSFYREAFGWRIDPMPDMDYTIVGTTPTDESGMPTELGGINGGMLERQAPITGPVITVDVEDIESALQRIEKLGGKTQTPKQTVGDMGFSAYFTDTEGNLMGLWESVRQG